MRLFCYLFGILSLMGVMCACGDDAADGVTVSAGTEMSPDNITYLNVSFAMAGSGSLTRSTGDYDYGEGYENAVESCLLLFYDDEGEYMASSELTDTDNITWESDPDNVAGTYTTLLILGLTSYPTQVLAILNYSGSESLKGKPLEEVLKTTVEALPTSSSEGGDFIMSNSVYVKDGKFVYAQPVEESYFYGEGEESTESLTIYVEREVAKVTIGTVLEASTRGGSKTERGKYYAELQGGDEGGNYLVYLYMESTDEPMPTLYSDRAFRIYIDGWAVNATNEEGYLVKKVKDDWLSDADFLEENIWYNSSDYCTWWAYDDNYDSNENVVTNFSWNDVAEQGTSDEAAYYHENTASYTAQTTYNQPGTEACTPTLIVAAHIAVNGPVDASRYFTNTLSSGGIVEDVFYKNGIYYSENVLMCFIADELNDDGYRTAEGDTLTYDNITLSVSEGELTWGLDDGLALYKDGSQVSEWPELSITEGLTIFKEGACYYQIPIKQGINSADIDGSGNTDKIDYCGLVRNHSYEIILNSISGVGHNVADLDASLPLIPSEDETSYLIANINILDWELVEQTVYINSENNE